MEKYLNKFYEIVDKIGKQNFILILFILVALISTGLYQTFSIYTESEGLSLIDGIETYSFILNASNTTNSVTIASGNSKYIDITVANDTETKLKYGLYYSSTSDLSMVVIGYRASTANLPSSTIDANSNYIVTIRVDNYSSNSVTINFGLKYGFENGGDLTLDDGDYWIKEYGTELLSEMPVGSYVKYVGNNGCDGESCSGQNANYVSDTDMGYCYSSSYKFTKNGWRIAYTKNKNVYLVSAGAPECMCTDADGNPSTSCDTYIESEDNIDKHYDNMNSVALKYCNTDFAKNGVCNLSTAWAMKESDFQKITGSTLSSASTCYSSYGSGYSSGSTCNFTSDLIVNGSYYWFATNYSTYYSYFWNANVNGASNNISNFSLGVRPVLLLDSTVSVISGTGSYEDPYVIYNSNSGPIEYLNEASPGDYVAYVGDSSNGCVGEACSGQNANYVDDTNMGYCGVSSYKFNANGWRVGYVENNSAYLISAGATDCMCTDADGNASTSCDTYLSATDLYKHFENMDNVALNYCNSTYAKGGKCDNTTSWAMDATDFEKITGSALNSSSCYASVEDRSCGYNNDLIDNGGYYWYATAYGSSSQYTLLWIPAYRSVGSSFSNGVRGLRPVLYLDPSVRVVGGSGTYGDPYVISK